MTKAMEHTRLRTSIRIDASRIPPHKQLTSVVRSWRQAHLSKLIQQPLDRIAELGDERTYGHTGCVNAISWAQNGELLLTGSDDTNVCMWRLDPSNIDDDFPLVNTAIIETGHDANIFAAHMLPYSTKIVTCSLDSQVRVSDVGHGHVSGRERGFRHSTSAANVAVYRCHGSASKRVLLEDSPDTFLTVAEDGRVRQHDLRVRPHQCRAPTSMMFRARRKPDLDNCPPPLVRLPHELHSISSSPLVPHQFVVAGDSPYGYLFDRRHSGRLLQQEWGVPVESQSMTTCVRRFGRTGTHDGHITGARMARSNSHEVVLSYTGDGVHLFSLWEDTTDSPSSRLKARSIVPPNRSPKVVGSGTESWLNERKDKVASNSDDTSPQPVLASASDKDKSSTVSDEPQESLCQVAHAADEPAMDQCESIPQDVIEPEGDLDDDVLMSTDSHSSADDHADVPLLVSVDGSNDDDEEDEYIYADEEGEDYEDGASPHDDVYKGVPIVRPRMRYTGAANTRTIKDVNFIGPGDELVASGSDDGNFFLWDKTTGKLQGIYEGDGSVVNVIEAHPFLPILAISGIDSTVKIFGPSRSNTGRFNKTELADVITTSNEERSRRPVGALTRIQLMQMLALHRVGGSAASGLIEDEDGSLECATQ